MLPSVNYADADSVPSSDVPLALLHKKIAVATSEDEKQKYEKEVKQILESRSTIDATVNNILLRVSENDEEKFKTIKGKSKAITRENMHCAKAISKAFSDFCFKTASNQYAAAALGDLIKTCNVDWITPEKTTEVIRDVCSELHKPTAI